MKFLDWLGRNKTDDLHMKQYNKKETPKPSPELPKEKITDGWTMGATEDTLINLNFSDDQLLKGGEITLIYSLTTIGQKNNTSVNIPVVQKSGNKEHLRKHLHELVDSLFDFKLKDEVSNESIRSKQTKKRRGKTNSK